MRTCPLSLDEGCMCGACDHLQETSLLVAWAPTCGGASGSSPSGARSCCYQLRAYRTPAPGTAQPRPSSTGGRVLPNRTHRPALDGTRQDSNPDSVFSPCFSSAPAGPQNCTGAPARGPPLSRARLQEAACQAVGSSYGRGCSPPSGPQGRHPPSLCRPVQPLGLAAWDSRGSVRQSPHCSSGG